MACTLKLESKVHCSEATTQACGSGGQTGKAAAWKKAGMGL